MKLLNEETAFVSSSVDGTACCMWSSEPREGTVPKYRCRKKKNCSLTHQYTYFFFFENGNMNVTKRGQDGQDDQVR